jgi:hypothetical protein
MRGAEDALKGVEGTWAIKQPDGREPAFQSAIQDDSANGGNLV